MTGRVESHGFRTWEITGSTGDQSAGICTVRVTGWDSVIAQGTTPDMIHPAPIDTSVVTHNAEIFEIVIKQDSVIPGYGSTLYTSGRVQAAFRRTADNWRDSVALGDGFYSGRAVYKNEVGLERYGYHHSGVSMYITEEYLTMISFVKPLGIAKNGLKYGL